MISLEKLKILTPFQNLPKNVENLGKWIVAKGFKKFPKFLKIAQFGHTDGVARFNGPTSILIKIKGENI